MLPMAELNDQATVMPDGRFTTENCLVAAGATVGAAGLTLVGEAVKVIADVPRTAEVDEFLAVTVTLC